MSSITHSPEYTGECSSLRYVPFFRPWFAFLVLYLHRNTRNGLTWHLSSSQGYIVIRSRLLLRGNDNQASFRWMARQRGTCDSVIRPPNLAIPSSVATSRRLARS